jgi:hypothetical protein
VIGEDEPVPVAPPGEAVTVYEVIGNLLKLGAVNVTDALASPAVAVPMVGAVGTPLGLADDPMIGIALFYHANFL